ncbi:HET domain-containing protein [Aspergillus vadensis CBS 113365]|uniref:HET-domain-containing protein n=1 Tax=Aspergillus vadensis (strain CBS 113365 / IMI 142717 / IBT 24658) TaxID=1448311 RepID=A0A319B454_ASPVC|nr:HET-domain-containing protein [Aspergillus vadensis CBS 113365]PYH66611.1 HET-domain-containing protein [Aspergillus vadensis CBS 113365]
MGSHDYKRKPRFSSRHQTCSLCQANEGNLVLRYHSPKGYYQNYRDKFHGMTANDLFHTECSECSNIQTDPLCQFCAHMRLGHLARCILVSEYDAILRKHRWYTRNTDYLRGFNFNLGTLKDVQKRSTSCQTCGTFASHATSIANQNLLPSQTMIKLDVRLNPALMRGIKYELVITLSLGSLKASIVATNYQNAIFFGAAGALSGNNLISLQRPEPQVNWNRVITWLQDCADGAGHEVPHHHETYDLPVEEFRVIDTYKRCVILAPQDCKYATLSYVWGRGGDLLQAKLDNIDNLGKEGSLADDDCLPATINNAIEAFFSLGIPFLWVDRLCILQDDEPCKKAKQLNAMGKIYNQSYLTLVAMAGSDAHYGLPGTNSKRRSPMWTGQTQGIYLLQDIDAYNKICQSSKWQTRGWTFQEAILSPRLLVFTDQGVFYHCHGKTAPEDEDCPGHYSTSSDVQIPWSKYSDLLGEYTSRDLTCKSDILFAFSGILHFLYGQNHHYGLPFSDFSRALLWKTKDGKYPMRYQNVQEMFPSWSWLSVDNEIRLSPRNGRWERISASLAQIAIPSSQDGQTRWTVLQSALTDPHKLDSRDFKVHILARLAVLVAWKGGCFPGKLPKALDAKVTWEEYDDIIRRRWTSLAQMVDEAYCMQGGLLAVSDQEARFPPKAQHACRDGCILVYTQSLRLRMERPEGSMGYVKLLDQGGNIVGWLEPTSINWGRLRHIPDWNNGAEFDVLALSLPYDTKSTGLYSVHHPAQSYDRDVADWRDSEQKTIFINDYFSHYYVHVVTVNLMVVESENGIRKRVALAEAALKIWIQAKPQFHTFILG